MARLLVTKLGLDGHDVGVKVLAAMARDAGHEVVYMGIRQTADAVVRAAVDEDVDLVAVSLLSGAHGVLMPNLVRKLREHGCNAPVIVGGLVPREDEEALLDAGIAAVVRPGTSGARAIEIMEALIAGTPIPHEDAVGTARSSE